MLRSAFGRALIGIAAAACLTLTALLSYAVLLDQAGANTRFPGQQDDADQPLPKLFQTPPFTLTDRHGKPFRSDQLQGKVWIADFFYTRCKLVCPILTKRMHQIADRLKQQNLLGPVQLVSVNVDPDHDTPKVVDKYAAKHHAGADWHLLTGDRSKIYPMIRQGFKLPVDATPKKKQMQIQHSARLVLVDQSGEIRGYYHGLEQDSVDKIIHDAQRLLSESGR